MNYSLEIPKTENLILDLLSMMRYCADKVWVMEVGSWSEHLLRPFTSSWGRGRRVTHWDTNWGKDRRYNNRLPAPPHPPREYFQSNINVGSTGGAEEKASFNDHLCKLQQHRHCLETTNPYKIQQTDRLWLDNNQTLDQDFGFGILAWQ